jgi:hypothetical protein
MQGQRYRVERGFEDAKGECGLADYQAPGWRSWHHHVTMVMLAMLFIAEQRVAHQPSLALLTPRDIVEMLKETLPRKPQGKDALVARINHRHETQTRRHRIPLSHPAQEGTVVKGQKPRQVIRLCQISQSTKTKSITLKTVYFQCLLDVKRRVKERAFLAWQRGAQASPLGAPQLVSALVS